MVDKVDIALSGTRDAIRGQLVPTIDGKIVAPPNIIPNVTAARAIYYKYRTEHLKRIQLYAQIEGIIAGNPPYNPVELDKSGLGHIANFNNLDARSLYERGALAYWNLLNEAETIIQFELRGDDPNLVKWQDIMSKHWDYVVRQWPAFYTHVNTLTGQLVKFGISACIWPDERDWRWRTIELSRFFVPDQAQADLEQLTAVCVETTFTAQYLWNVYLEFKDKPKGSSPWDTEELGKLLLYRANTHAKTDNQILDMMDMQKRLENGDIGYTTVFSDSIRVVSLFYKEYGPDNEPGITHYMFDRTYEHHTFIFKSDRQYRTMNEAICIFTASPGEFTIHSNRGLGHKIFSGCQATMQFDCSIVDAGRWASTPLIKSLATGSRDFEAIRFYPGVPTNIGTAEFVENTMGANIAQLVNASQYIMQKLQYNTANSGDDPGVPDRNVGSISPSQARMQTYKEFGVLKNNIAHFYSQFDRVLQTMVIRMLKAKKGYPGYEYVKEWQTRCLEDGVPAEMFASGDAKLLTLPRQLLKVCATRVAGDGSTLARLMGLEALQAISGDFGPKAAKEYQRQYIMATMGKTYVKAFITPEEPDEQAGGASLAGVENAVMQEGHSPIFSPENEHRSHIAVHFALGSSTIQQIQQQQTDAVAADKIFAVLIPHLDEHIQAVSKSQFAQTFVKQIVKPWDQLMQYAKMNRKAAAKEVQAQMKKQQEDQAATQQLLNDEQRKNVQVQGDEKRKDFKIQSQVQRASEANQTRAEIMKTKIEKDAENQRLKVVLDAQVKAGQQPSVAETSGAESPSQELASINGRTIAPYDIEGVANGGYVSPYGSRPNPNSIQSTPDVSGSGQNDLSNYPKLPGQ